MGKVSFNKASISIGGKKIFETASSKELDVGQQIEVRKTRVTIRNKEVTCPTAYKLDRNGKTIGSVSWINHHRTIRRGYSEGIEELCFDIFNHEEYWEE